MIQAPTLQPSLSTVHVLTVHGVGGFDHLSNLLRTYQSFRANLKSVEAPVMGEDQIPGWRLTHFEEGETPPFLTLEPRVAPPAGGVGAVRLYEVNYSNFAGVIRHNHRIDLTNLFLGLDFAVCAARQRMSPDVATVFGHRTAQLGACLQRVSGVLTAGTVPIIGLPSLLFRNYLGTFIGTFTRFFEDITTFALDKNGEQLISAHLDRSLDAIAHAMAPGDRLVVAAHSLGSVVVHNFIVRRWASAPERVPDGLVTFGSPIGLLMWTWLFLDFPDMDFNRRLVDDTYFCWNPISVSTASRKPMRWINIVNCVDPIATAFPTGAVDLSAGEAAIGVGLVDGKVLHRFFGPARVRSVGGAHTEYLNDKEGFLKILLRAAALSPGVPEDVAGTRTAEEHWAATQRVLRKVQWGALLTAWMLAAAYCYLIADQFDTSHALWFVVIFLWPALTIGFVAFFQRLILGGPTKRITAALIREMTWGDPVSFPFRLRAALLAKTDQQADIDPMAPSPSYWIRLVIKALAFVPTLVLMAVPVIGTAWWTGDWSAADRSWPRLWGVEGLLVLGVFMAYVMSCAAFELVRTWRQVVRLLTR